jgi:hypothetical protein
MLHCRPLLAEKPNVAPGSMHQDCSTKLRVGTPAASAVGETYREPRRLAGLLAAWRVHGRRV